VCALKAGIVVKLSIVGKAEEPPVCRQAGQHVQGGKSCLGPSRRQAAVEGDSIKHGDGGAAADRQVFDEIEGELKR
jgi:hypothetical protein